MSFNSLHIHIDTEKQKSQLHRHMQEWHVRQCHCCEELTYDTMTSDLKTFHHAAKDRQGRSSGCLWVRTTCSIFRAWVFNLAVVLWLRQWTLQQNLNLLSIAKLLNIEIKWGFYMRVIEIWKESPCYRLAAYMFPVGFTILLE